VGALVKRTAITLALALFAGSWPAYAQNQSLAANAAPAPVGTPLTLAQAEAIALKNNPQITIGKLRALEAQQYVRETRSALLPTAFLSLTGVDSRSGSRIAAGALNNPVIFPRAASGATVSQLITDFGHTTNLLSSSEFQAKAEDKNAAATAADITLAVDQAFYNSLETEQLVKVAQQTLNARQTFVDKIQALTNAKLQQVLFTSGATNLGSGQQIYERDVSSSTTTLVSAIDATANPANSYSIAPSVSDDGNVVAFESGASDLTATTDKNSPVYTGCLQRTDCFTVKNLFSFRLHPSVCSSDRQLSYFLSSRSEYYQTSNPVSTH